MALNVKVGDKVIYSTWCTKKVTTITKITPTGRIRVDCTNSQFDKDGREMGADHWNVGYIYEADEAAIQEIRDKCYVSKALKLMRAAGAADITVEDAKIIIGILDKENKY